MVAKFSSVLSPLHLPVPKSAHLRFLFYEPKEFDDPLVGWGFASIYQECDAILDCMIIDQIENVWSCVNVKRRSLIPIGLGGYQNSSQ